MKNFSTLALSPSFPSATLLYRRSGNGVIFRGDGGGGEIERKGGERVLSFGARGERGGVRGGGPLSPIAEGFAPQKAVRRTRVWIGGGRGCWVGAEKHVFVRTYVDASVTYMDMHSLPPWPKIEECILLALTLFSVWFLCTNFG